MSEIAESIVPIFIIIFLGLGLKRTRLLPAPFLASANQLVYYVAIPAMIFRVIARVPFQTNFRIDVVAATVIPLFLIVPVALLLARVLRLNRASTVTFCQAGFHGNLGYIGLAVAFYYLGESGLAQAGILVGILMILQNVMAVLVLGGGNEGGGRLTAPGFWVKNLVLHPVIASTVAGAAFSLAGFELPKILERSLGILGGMALPTALLLIGASLSLEKLKGVLRPTIAAGIMKMVLLPAMGLAVYRLIGLESREFLPGLILLAAPVATMTYVLAREMNGDPDLASASMSSSTLVSALTYIAWLGLVA